MGSVAGCAGDVAIGHGALTASSRGRACPCDLEEALDADGRGVCVHGVDWGGGLVVRAGADERQRASTGSREVLSVRCAALYNLCRKWRLSWRACEPAKNGKVVSFWTKSCGDDHPELFHFRAP